MKTRTRQVMKVRKAEERERKGEKGEKNAATKNLEMSWGTSGRFIWGFLCHLES